MFVDALNAREQNARRIRSAAFAVAVCIAAAWILGGYWYLHFYPADKVLILNGPWPFAHNVFMETKEHLFFLTLILSFYLPLATRDALHSNSAGRRMVLCVALLIALSGLAIEGAGAVINHGAEVALVRANGNGCGRALGSTPMDGDTCNCAMTIGTFCLVRVALGAAKRI